MLHVIIVENEKTAKKIITEHFGKGVGYVSMFPDSCKLEITHALNGVQGDIAAKE